MISLSPKVQLIRQTLINGLPFLNLNKLRTYGMPPFQISLIHGGPGAAGEMAPVAQRLSSDCGILEPIQTVMSVNGQVEELKTVLEEYGDLPVVLIGYSWGAWVSYLVAARYPVIIKKLILIGCGGFEDKYGKITNENRISRLSDLERSEFESIQLSLKNPTGLDTNKLFIRLGELVSKVDSYDPISSNTDNDPVDFNAEIFSKVWPEADEMRRSGELLEYGKQIKCPVVAIHGDYDPHPAEGVEKPLLSVLKDFRFILLKKCGHKPWIERHAKDRFYELLKNELQ